MNGKRVIEMMEYIDPFDNKVESKWLKMSLEKEIYKLNIWEQVKLCSMYYGCKACDAILKVCKRKVC